MSLNRARILSSENDSSCKQEQSTNINIKIQPKQSQPSIAQPVPQQQRQSSNQSVNFTQPLEQSSPSPSTQPTNNTVQERGIIDLGADISSLEMKNKFLEILLSIYETNPIKVNDLLICHSQTLMELIKILTNADKVELIVNDESGCTGCLSNTKYLSIDRILVYINNESFDLKYQFNNVYTELIRHNISLKTCI